MCSSLARVCRSRFLRCTFMRQLALKPRLTNAGRGEELYRAPAKQFYTSTATSITAAMKLR